MSTFVFLVCSVKGNYYMRTLLSKYSACVFSVFASLPLFAAWQPGLNSIVLSGSAINKTSFSAAVTNNVLSPVIAATPSSGWGQNSTYVYWGQIYLDGSTYTFAESIDDAVYLKIDGTELLNDNAWNRTTVGSITRNPGWYDFEVRFFNGTGGAGPANQDGWGTTAFGFGYNKSGYTGKSSAYYALPVEPGDQSLFQRDDGMGFDDALEITTSPGSLPVPGLEYKTVGGISAGESFSLSVPLAYTNSADGIAYECTGWKLYDMDRQLVGSGSGNSLSYTHPDPIAFRKLVWQWKVLNRVSLSAVNSAVTPSEAWVETGATLTISASPNDGYEWVGWRSASLPIEERRTAELVITVNGPTTFTAVSARASSATGTTYYVADYGNDSNDGLSWGTAKKSLDQVVNGAADGDCVVISDGSFPLSGTMTISAGVKVYGAGRDLTVITGTNLCTRAFFLDNDKAEVSDLTIDGITYNADKNRNTRGLGFYIQKGYVHDCRIRGNNVKNVYYISGKGAAMTGGHLSRVIIEDCTEYGNGDNHGGGLYMTGGIADNIIVRNCYSSKSGGGVYISGGILANATIYGNTTVSGSGGGIYIDSKANTHPEIYNVISYGNTANTDVSAGAPNWYVANSTLTPSKVFSFASVPPLGTDPVSSGIDFVNPANGDFSLQPSSRCIDSGMSLSSIDGISGTDLNGIERPQGAGWDIGCYEYKAEGIVAGLRAEPDVAFTGSSFSFIPTLFGIDGTGLEYEWTVTGANGQVYSGTGIDFAQVIDVPDSYTVALAVKSADRTVATVTRPGALRVVPRTIYVSTEGSATSPFATEATAARDLHDAIEEAIDGCTIIVAPGTYTTTSQYELTKGVKIFGTGATFDDVVLKQTSSGVGKRVLYLSHPDAVVSNVTITGGYITGDYQQVGCGVRIDPRGGTVTHSRITGNKENTFHIRGAGVYINSTEGRVSHCQIDNNSTTRMYARGGGVCAVKGLVENCLIFGNTAVTGAGIYLAGPATIRHCTVVGNSSTGTYAYSAGAGLGIEASGGTVINTVFDRNSAPNDGSVGRPEWYESGNQSYTLDHCIFPEGVTLPPEANLSDTCNATPLYEDAAGLDYRPTSASPVFNAGVAYEGMAETDFAGNPRVSGSATDIGCYEIDANVLSCSLSFAPSALFVGETATFTPTLLGTSPGAVVDYEWVLDDGKGHRYTSYEESPRISLDVAGWYDVTVTARVAGVVAQYTSPEKLHFASRTNYLAVANEETSAAAAYPWDTPDTAHTNLNELSRELIAGSVVIAAEGTHYLTKEVVLDKGEKLIGAGMDLTVFKSSGLKIRHFVINHRESLIEGITSDGASLAGEYSQYGFAVLIGANGGTLSRSRVTNASAGTYHLLGAVALIGDDSLIENCFVNGNQNKFGYAYSAGILVSKGVARGCVSYGNTNVWAGGGAGLYLSGSGLAVNCTVVDNHNTATETSSGGVCISGVGARARNCIFWGNTSAEEGGNPEWRLVDYATESAFENCCFAVNPVGTGAISGDPCFIDPLSRNYDISSRSSCRNAGKSDPEHLLGVKGLDGESFETMSTKPHIGAYRAPLVGSVLYLR